ncbi:MAG: hypothetical protein HPY44_08270 [Armatimonadetes bacterium]|nr:hypothetical protein [Armatimonadota bacterium]
MARRIARPVDPQARRRAVILSIAAGCGGTAGLLLLVALVGYAKLTAKPPQPKEAEVAGASLPSQGVSLGQQVQDISRRASSGQAVPFQLELSSADINANLGPVLQRQGLEDIQIYLGDGTAVAQGRAELSGRKLWTTLRVKPSVANGKARFEVVEATIGTVPMPNSLRQKVQEEIDEAIAKDPMLGQSVWLSDLQIRGGKMYVQGTTTGRK